MTENSVDNKNEVEEVNKENDNYDDLKGILTDWINRSEMSENTSGPKEEVCPPKTETVQELDILNQPIVTVDSPTAIYKVKVDKKSILYIDGNEVSVVEPNVLTSITLPQNEYIRTIVEYGNEANMKEDVICLTRDKAELITLKKEVSSGENK